MRRGRASPSGRLLPAHGSVQGCYFGKSVTAEAAGSSPVVPAIHSQELIGSAPFSRGHKKAQNRYRKSNLSGQSLRLLRFLWAQECDNGILRIALTGLVNLRSLVASKARLHAALPRQRSITSGFPTNRSLSVCLRTAEFSSG